MGSTIIISLLFSIYSFLGSSPGSEISYWESNGEDPWLAQIIHSHDDQGEDILHINLYLSENCSTKMYYAMPLNEKNLFVLTDTFGKVVEEKTEIVIKDRGVLKLDGRKFQKISKEKYFADMKRFESLQTK